MSIEEFFRKNNLALYIIAISLAIVVASGLYIHISRSEVQSYIHEKAVKYKKTLELYQKFAQCKKQKGLFKNNLFSFVQILKKELNLNKKILSATPVLNQAQETIDIKFSSLNLSEFLDVLKKTNSYGDLSIKQFVLTKNFTNPKLLDLDLIVGKIE